jgi:hypothetical protein
MWLWGKTKINAQIFILNVCSKLLRNQNCQRVWNRGLYVPFFMANIRVLNWGRKYFFTCLVIPLAKLLWLMYFEREKCSEATQFRYWPINPLTPELNPSAQRCLTRFLLGILLLEPWISLIYAWKTNKRNNYSFSLLIMYGISYMFRHYIILRVGSSDVVRTRPTSLYPTRLFTIFNRMLLNWASLGRH